METRANYIAIGTFALLTMVLSFAFVGWLVSAGNNNQKRDLEIVFPGSVTGLEIGGWVYFNGIKVGEVRKLSLNPDDPNSVTVVVGIDGSSPLRADTRATLGFSALTGVAYIELVGGSVKAEQLFAKDGVPHMTAEPSAFQDLVQGARQIMSQADHTLSAVNSLVDDNRQAISNTVGNVNRFSEALASNADGVEKFMGGVSDAAAAFTSLSSRMEKLVDSSEAVVAAVEPAKVARVVDNVARASDRLEHAVAGVDEVVASAKKTMAQLEDFGTGLNGTLERVDALVAAVDPGKVQSIVGNVDDVSKRIAARGDDIDALIVNARAASDSIKAVSSAIETRSQVLVKFIDDAGRLGEELTNLTGNLNTTMTDVDRIVKSVDATKIANVLASVETITSDIASETGTIKAAIADARTAAGNVNAFTSDLRAKQPDIDQIITDAKQLAGRLNAASTRIDGILEKVDGFIGADGQGFIAEATEAARSIRAIAKTFEGRAGPIADGLARFSGRGLRDLQSLIEQGRQTLEEFEKAASGFDRDPSRVIFGGSDVPVYDGRKRR